MRDQNDQNVVSKMCSYICCCFTCFSRPEDKKHEYNNVPNNVGVENPDSVNTKMQNKRNMK